MIREWRWNETEEGCEVHDVAIEQRHAVVGELADSVYRFRS